MECLNQRPMRVDDPPSKVPAETHTDLLHHVRKSSKDRVKRLRKILEYLPSFHEVSKISVWTTTLVEKGLVKL